MGIRDIHVVYRAGRINAAAYASLGTHSQKQLVKEFAEQEVEVATVQTETSTIQSLLQSAPLTSRQQCFAVALRKFW